MPGTVTVASKLPWPLRLQLQESYPVSEEIFGGGVREKMRYRKVGPEVVINGCAVHMDRPNDKQIVGGAALTHGVDADFWAKWVEQHKGFPPVRDGLIFAHAKPEVAASEARNVERIKSGFEATDPSDLPEEFRERSGRGVKAA